MKTAEEVKPNYAPVYAAALYPELAALCVKHGYALAVHGSLARDFDLIAVPWVKTPSEPQAVLDEIQSRFNVKLVGEVGAKPHGRVAYSLSIGFGWCQLDFSFMPRLVCEECGGLGEVALSFDPQEPPCPCPSCKEMLPPQ